MVTKDKTWRLERVANLNDKDLGTGRHDKMCLWFSEKENYMQVLKDIGHLPRKTNVKFNLQWEEPIKQGNYVIGFPDFLLTVNDKKEKQPRYYVIEIKPKIDSVGKVMRQLKLYKSYLKNFHPILVTTTKKFKKVFNDQGISYYVLKERTDTFTDGDEIGFEIEDSSPGEWIR
jgi:hypothetical protein